MQSAIKLYSQRSRTSFTKSATVASRRKVIAHTSVVVGIVSAMFVSWIIVRQSGFIDKLIGSEGALIIMRLLGFLLAALAIEIGSAGIRDLFLS